MKKNQQQNYYLYYTLHNSIFNFLYTVRNCKRPEQTKEYKKLRAWLNRSTVYSIGYCTTEYFEDHNSEFVSPNLTYLQIN